ncbi:putative RDD family membrane protein YckC [Microbacterium endophyticum]|uniref:Putative RDD family membrane protein YckC n=1 Tax=Microbacterium endophyticum TaxID=1526412 RepID=A0A7W4V414_9MICO|nr:RDD family protein [Microbacterium endophyticum]MBB2976319.1 putative RDD family membrane protein YckC [Microbacterium endophyticum]NIK35199.1 putative RDD family membrane protein YckC [Microbacterium endophyticum]
MPALPASVPVDSVALDVSPDEILTGEAVALDVQPVGFFLRGLGAMIDVALGVALVVVMLLVSFWLTSAGALPESAGTILMIASLVTALVILPTVVETATRGRSLGKLAVGGRVVRVDGGSAGFRHAFIRALLGVLEVWITLGAVAALVGAFTPRAQRLGDLVAGTYSERTRTPMPPAVDLPVPPQLAGWAQTVDITRLPDRLARRCAQFIAGSGTLDPASRVRVASALVSELSAHVSPMPEGDVVSAVYGIVAVRRRRERGAIEAQRARVLKLMSGATVTPPGFPNREKRG